MKVKQSRENYKIQRNLCKKLLRKTKKSYFESLNTKKVTDSRTFWKTVAPLFTNKASRDEKITLTEAEKHISDNRKTCTIFNSFFSNVVSDLKIPDYYNYFPQKIHGSILGPLLFNIDLIDLCYGCEESNIASYADDTTPYPCARDTQTVISELQSLAKFFVCSSIIILKRIQENSINF